MLHKSLLIVLFLLFLVSMLSMLSKKIRVPYPIFLVISGLVIWLIPGLPSISMDPDWIFLIFLPPLLYEAAWYTSWTNFWKDRKAIGLLAFAMVIFTSGIVALVSVKMIPGFTLALGFLLGGIVSPPDAVAATSILKNMRIPKRIQTLLEGESLMNDASSLIVFRFALLAILTGKISFSEITISFFVVSLMGIAVGLIIAMIVYTIHRFFPTTPNIDTVLTLVTPYVMYLTAEHFNFSGVMSVVSGGLFLASRSSHFFNYSSRLQATHVWRTFVFLLNGFVFILIGLQLPYIIDSMRDYSTSEAIFYGLIICTTVILVRITMFFTAYFINIRPNAKKTESKLDWKAYLLMGWAGMRGVVSLAAALAIPLTLYDGTAFPKRNLILFITFVVILITLVFQGLSLPFLIQVLKISDKKTKTNDKQNIHMDLLSVAVNFLDKYRTEEVKNHRLFFQLRERYTSILEELTVQTENNTATETLLPYYRSTLLKIIDKQRQALLKMRQKKDYDDALIREKEIELDLQQARLNDI